MMGMSAPEWSRYLHDQLGVPLEPERINELVVAALLDQYRRRLPLLPGAVVAVRRLADRWPLALASSANRPVIDAVLERAGIADCFAITVSGEEVTAGKPAPDVYLAATRRLGVDPGDAIIGRTPRFAALLDFRNFLCNYCVEISRGKRVHTRARRHNFGPMKVLV